MQSKFVWQVKILTENEVYLMNILSDYMNSVHNYTCIDSKNITDTIHLAEIHKILPILYYETNTQLSKILTKEEFNNIKNDIIIQISIQENKDILLRDIINCFEQNNLSYFIYKGLVCKSLYKNSEYRLSSDEDFLMKKDDMNKAVEILKKMDFFVMSRKNSEIKLLNMKNMLIIELHSSLLDNYTEDNEYINSLLISQFRNPYCMNYKNISFKTFKPTYNYLILIIHLFNHFIKGGVGIRQIMDIAKFYDTYFDEINFNLIRNILERIDALYFYDAVMFICKKYFSIDCKTNVDENIAENLLSDIFEAGAYGAVNKIREHSGALTHRIAQEKKGKIYTAIDIIYPSDEKMKEKYPQLNKAGTSISKFRLIRLLHFAGEKDKLKAYLLGRKRKVLLKKLRIISMRGKKMRKNKCVFLIGSSEVSICNFRKELVERLLKEGYKVIISSPYGRKFDELIEKGCVFVDTPMHRRSKNFFHDLPLFFKYIFTMLKYHPGVVITYTIKPNLYGSIAAKILRIPCIMNITGLGTELENGGATKTALISALKPLMKASYCVFFQNIVHLNMFKEMEIIKNNYKLVAGSGVNLKEHKVLPYNKNNDDINFLFVGRLMYEKGIGELVEATKIAKEKNPAITVTALGFCEDEYEETFKKLNAENTIEYLPYTDDVDAVIKKCDAVINPSYHEGMSNALLEGAACGRPVLASNVTGCVETLDDGKTGLIFKVKNAQDIAEKMLIFADLPSEARREMGINGRKKVEREFDREDVVDSYMEEIRKILKIKQDEKVFEEIDENAESFSPAGNI